MKANSPSQLDVFFNRCLPIVFRPTSAVLLMCNGEKYFSLNCDNFNQEWDWNSKSSKNNRFLFWKNWWVFPIKGFGAFQNCYLWQIFFWNMFPMVFFYENVFPPCFWVSLLKVTKKHKVEKSGNSIKKTQYSEKNAMILLKRTFNKELEGAEFLVGNRVSC